MFRLQVLILGSFTFLSSLCLAEAEAPNEEACAKEDECLRNNQEFVKNELKGKTGGNLIGSLRFLSDFTGKNLGPLSSVYNSVLDFYNNKKVWDSNSLANAGLAVAEVASYVSGIGAIPVTFFRGIHIAYNLPPVQNSIHKLAFGVHLYGPTTFIDSDEFSPAKLNNPYLKCNYYEKLEDISQGYKPLHSLYVTKKVYPHLENSSYYMNFVILHGRWMKAAGLKFDSFRFASIDNVLEIYDACYSMFLNQGVIQSPMRKEDYYKILPQASYAEFNLTYPIYFYIDLNNGKDYMLLGSKKKDRNESKEIEKLYSQHVETGEKLHDVKKIIEKDVKNWELFQIMDELIFLQGEYADLQNAYERGNGLSGDLVLRNAGFAHNVVKLSRLSSPNAWYFGLFASLVSSIYLSTKVIANNSYLNENIDEFVYGKYLHGPDNCYDLEEFNTPQLSETNLVCSYYEKATDIGVKSPLIINAYQGDVPVVLKGRWMRLERGSNAFAILNKDPLILRKNCIEALSKHKEVIPEEYKYENLLENIVPFVGLAQTVKTETPLMETDLTSNMLKNVLRMTHYPIFTYYKQNIPVKGNVKKLEKKACIYNPHLIPTSESDSLPK